MKTSARDSYLEAKILTATPQKLHLMSIDGAIRFATQARHFWEAGEDERASDSLIRAQQIVSQLLGGLDHQVAPQLTGKVASVYLFVYRALVEANLRRDVEKLDDAMRVLEIERETWRLVCAELAGLDDAAADAPYRRSEPAERGPASPPRHARGVVGKRRSPRPLAGSVGTGPPGCPFSTRV